jgi:hypothetical protein
LSWVPRPSPAAQVLGLDLSLLEGYVLSRIDGATDVKGIVLSTGISTEEVSRILDRLVRQPAAPALRRLRRAVLRSWCGQAGFRRSLKSRR